MESTFVLLKPDAVKRNLIGKIIQIYEEKGLTISHIKMIKPEMTLMKEHYANLKHLPFFNSLIEYMTSHYSVALVLSGKNAVSIVRTLNGLTDPQKADINSIRGRFGLNIGRNLVHGSEDKENAEREIKLWFGNEKMREDVDPWIYE
ncbi:nucleoside diphosphate kinase [Pseudoloma neurophilia]|uniref:Nucleoside diphosphate kinase n=1 Tax=Pseudoloma neurophilia TaxID=146866 RepID=A0A0R0M758_9MICR|nr:nucleoside diphosphate kinase [Pseudoloma neurophilia]